MLIFITLYSGYLESSEKCGKYEWIFVKLLYNIRLICNPSLCF